MGETKNAMTIAGIAQEGSDLELRLTSDLRIGIEGSHVRARTTMRDALAAQDGLYTLVLRHGDGTWEPRVIGSIAARSVATVAYPPNPTTISASSRWRTWRR